MIIGRFLGVGLACAVMHNVVMIVGDAAGLHYAASSVISLVVVTILGYQLHSRWTYAGAERSRASFGRYALAVSANFPLSLAGLFVLVDLLGVSTPIAAPVVTVVLLAFNFTANRWALRLRRNAT
jgi:putative flippase GtrA